MTDVKEQNLTKRRKPYPKNRKKAKRTRESYRANTPETLEKQLAALARGRGNRRKYKKLEPKATPWQKLVKYKLTKAEIAQMNIIEFTRDCLGITLYPVQETILRSLYGLPLNLEQFSIYKELTGNETEFEARKEKTEAILVLGARSGKSFLSSICAVYEATAKAARWRKYLNPGEIAYVIVVATRQQQSQQIIGANCDRILRASRISDMVVDSLATELSLDTGINIVSMPATSTSGRGLAICSLILDELGWYKLEGVRADEEIYNALRPRMSQFRGAKMFAISTPAAKQGLLWQFFDEGFQVPGRLTVQAPTAFVNPTVDPAFLESEKRRNPDNYAREFLAEFAEQVDSFFPADKLRESFTLIGDVSFDSRYRYYCGIDQSGLSSGRDRFAASIAHSEGKRTIVDVSRTWATSDGDAIIAELKRYLEAYGITSVSVDRYATGWVRNAFERQSIEVTVRDLLPAIYVNLKSLVIAGRVSLPDTKGLRDGLLRTQAFYGRSNQLSIGHERTVEGHGDEADSVATAIWLASSGRSNGFFSAEDLS